jgi:DNA repair photolyase
MKLGGNVAELADALDSGSSSRKRVGVQALSSAPGALPLIRRAEAGRILSPTTGFIAEAGFTHSLTPARNCTYGCTYCYVPTLGVYGGLKPEDWRRWGQFTTFKTNAAKSLRRELRPDQTIYCSPLADPYQPAEAEERQMTQILTAVRESPPRVFVLQTRGPLILRDLELLQALRERTTLRVSFSVPTDREEILRLYEPRCPSFADRIETLRILRQAGIEVYATRPHSALQPGKAGNRRP